jgi:hypothetical protein
VLGVLCLSQSGWIHALARVEHLLNRDRTAAENIATVSDLFITAVLASYAAVELSVHKLL